MNVIDRIAGALGYSRPETSDKDYGAGMSSIVSLSGNAYPGADRPGKNNVDRYLQRYGDQAWVFACVQAIQDSASGVELKVYDETDPNNLIELPEHPLKELLDSVNPMMHQFDLLECHHGYMEIVGNSFWLLDKMVDGLPTQIYPINPDYMTPVISKSVGVTAYEYRINGVLIDTFDAAEVIHFKKWNPRNPFWGQAPISASRDSADTLSAADQYNAAFFKNSAETGGFLTTEKPLMADAIALIKAAWKKNHQGARKAHQVEILHGGMDWKSTTMTHKDMMFDQLKRMSREDILAVYKIPPVMVGVFDEANYSNADVQERIFWKRCILPRLRKFESALNERLAKPFGDNLVILHDISSVQELQEDEKTAAERDKTLTESGIKTINEVRSERKLETVPWGDVWNAPNNLLPIDQHKAPATPAAPGAPADDTNEPAEDPGEDPNADPEDAAEPKSVTVDKGWIRRTGIWTEFKGLSEKEERRWHPVLRALFSHQERQVISNARAHWVHAVRQIKLNNLVIKNELSVILFERGEARRLFQKEGKKLIEMTINDRMKEENQKHDLGLQFEVVNHRVTSFINSRAFKFSDEVNQTTEEELRRQLTEAIDAGESIAQVETRIEDVFDMARGYRTERIARTEVISASNAGAYEAYQESPVVEGSEWVSSRDSKVRDEHQIDGEEAPLDSQFSNGLKFPGDPDGEASNVINCFLPSTRVEGSFIAGVRSEYFGPAVDIVTRGGRTLSLTPNHPVLTPDGFVPAGQLRAADNLVGYRRVVSRRGAVSHIHEKNSPAAIEDVFDALRVRLLSLRRHLRPDDFHGDARWVMGEVDIVRPDGSLAFELPSSALELIEDRVLVAEGMRPALPSRERALLLRRHQVAAAAARLPRGAELTLHETLSSLQPGPLYPLRIGSASQLDSMLLEVGAQSRSRDAGAIGNALERFSEEIALDEIVEIRNREFRGHVYDLQSVSGLLIAGGIISHNCRCTIAPVTIKE